MLLAGLSSLVGRVPSQVVSVHREQGLAVLGTLHVLLHQLGRDTDDVLALPVLDHIEGLQRADDVLLGDAGHRTGGRAILGERGRSGVARKLKARWRGEEVKGEVERRGNEIT